MIIIEQKDINEETKAQIKAALKSGAVGVDFEKADGSVREMICTTDVEHLFTEEFDPEAEKKAPRKVNEDVQVVFDLNAQEWRSFRWDRVKKVYIQDQTPTKDDSENE